MTDGTKPPERIWVQVPPRSLSDIGMWCEERIDGADVEYVRADRERRLATFLRSVILCGEEWTDTCSDEWEAALGEDA